MLQDALVKLKLKQSCPPLKGGKMKIKKARKVMRKAFEKDPDLRMSYQANIAMVLYDDDAISEREAKRYDAMADKILTLIFEGN